MSNPNDCSFFYTSHCTAGIRSIGQKCIYSSFFAHLGNFGRITYNKQQPHLIKAGLLFRISYARYKEHVRTCAGLVDNLAALRHLHRRRCIRISSGSHRHRNTLHQTCRLEVHNLSCWLTIHFHNFPILGAKVRQIFDICKFLPYFLQLNDYFTTFPVTSYIFSPRRMKI
jgi:hypothetical protein